MSIFPGKTQYIPQNRCAYWINIKEYFEEHPQASRISYKCTKTNILRPDNFAKVFVPFVTGTLPEFTFEESWDLFHSTNKGEFSVGLLTLFRKYSDKIIVWDAFINYFRKTESSLIPSMFIYFLAHIPWHMDIFGGGDKITPESRHYVEGVINSFGKGEVIKLIQFIDENGIDRGSVGQSVVAIISSISERNAILAGIMIDETLPLEIREWANVLLLL